MGICYPVTYAPYFHTKLIVNPSMFIRRNNSSSNTSPIKETLETKARRFDAKPRSFSFRDNVADMILPNISPKPRSFFTNNNTFDTSHQRKPLLPQRLSELLSISSSSSPRSSSPTTATAYPKQDVTRAPARHCSKNNNLVISDYTKSGATLRQILDHNTLGPQFRAFAAERHADEGLRFLDEFTLLQTSSESSTEVAGKLIAEYFSDASPSSINLGNNTRDNLLERFHNGEYKTVGELFQTPMLDIFTDIKHGDAFRDFCKVNVEANAFYNDVNTLMLDTFIVPENFHLATKSIFFDHSAAATVNLVRFCCSVAEFERLPARSATRKAQGRKIASLFFHSGARFQLDSVAAMYVDAIAREEFEHVLSDARMECLQALALNNVLLETCREYYANGGGSNGS